MKTNFSKKIFSYLYILLTIGSCASLGRPNLYPNDTLKKLGQEKANADIDQCIKNADVYFNSPEGKKVVRGGLTTNSVGVGIGVGNNGLGFGAGLGSSNMASGSDVKRGFVNQCLENKGYQVLVWE